LYVSLRGCRSDVRCWHLADIGLCAAHVYFRGQSGHRLKLLECPLMSHPQR
jgi:hypothetical protein